jgi:hypothetical protein
LDLTTDERQPSNPPQAHAERLADDERQADDEAPPGVITPIDRAGRTRRRA